MKPITVRIPDGCLLSPAAEAAVVGGNVLTSQRVTDVVLSAFTAAAPSQVSICFYSTCSKGEPRGHVSGAAGLHEQFDIRRRGHGLLRDNRGRRRCVPVCALGISACPGAQALPRMQARGPAGTGAPACTRT